MDKVLLIVNLSMSQSYQTQHYGNSWLTNDFNRDDMVNPVGIYNC